MKRVPLMAGYERDAGGEALLKDLDITEEDVRDGISKSRFATMIDVFVKKRNKQYVLFHEDRCVRTRMRARMRFCVFHSSFFDSSILLYLLSRLIRREYPYFNQSINQSI